jgi:ATP phosphoribosyltransferase regulatory subunit
VTSTSPKLPPWPASGTIDRLFDDARALRSVEDAILTRLHERAYREIVVPLLERDAVFSSQNGAPDDGASSDAMRFVDRHGEVLGLRPDFTGSVARIVASRLADVPDVRLCYRGTVFRDAGAHARRQQQQAGFEHFGSGSVDEDVDAVATAVDVARTLRLQGITVSVGSAALINALAPHAGSDVRRALDRRDTTALPPSLLPLVHLVGERNVLDRARAELPSSTHEALSRLSAVVDALSQQGLRVVVDLAEVRPWTYYTGFVFSLWATGVPRVVCAGGRYDQLVGRFGVDRPAVGATFDVDAVLRVQGGA